MNRSSVQHTAIVGAVFHRAATLDSGEHLRCCPYGDCSARVFGAGHETARECCHQEAVLRFAQCDELFGVVDVNGDGFVDDGGNVSFKREFTGIKVDQIGRADEHAVNQVRVEHILIVCEYLAVGEPFIAPVKSFWRKITNSRHFHIGSFEQIRNVIVGAEESEANDTDFYFGHKISLSREATGCPGWARAGPVLGDFFGFFQTHFAHIVIGCWCICFCEMIQATNPRGAENMWFGQFGFVRPYEDPDELDTQIGCINTPGAKF